MGRAEQINMRAEWLRSAAEYTTGALTIGGFQVMQGWEDGYMAELAAIAARSGGRILEVGFGMGISARYIQRCQEVRSHVVIECHQDVVRFALAQCAEGVSSGRLILVNGFWEDVVPCLQGESFDGILFDSIELDREPHPFNSFAFFHAAHRLLRPGGVFTYFSDEPREMSAQHVQHLRQAGFTDIDYRVCRVAPPPDCRYWAEETIVAPIVTK